MNSVHTSYVVHRYVMEPGDGTRYVFSFFPINMKEKQSDQTLSGVHHGMWLSIEMPSQSMAMTIPLDAVIGMSTNNDDNFVDYIRGKAPQMDRYTICAVLLALSVLYYDITDINNAMKEMLRVPEILFKK